MECLLLASKSNVGTWNKTASYKVSDDKFGKTCKSSKTPFPRACSDDDIPPLSLEYRAALADGGSWPRPVTLLLSGTSLRTPPASSLLGLSFTWGASTCDASNADLGSKLFFPELVPFKEALSLARSRYSKMLVD